jgi:cystathionine beta-synthase
VHPYISEGFGEDFVPQNYDMSVIDHFEQVTDKEGALMARRIAKEEGIFIGYSAGSCVQGLLQIAAQGGKFGLKKDDLVVCIFHDHGSRYVAKIYNDQWMLERGFMDVKTFKDIVTGRGIKQKLVTIEPGHTVSDAVELMKKYDIEHIPVINGSGPIGSISENGLFQKVFSNPDIKNATVESVMEPAFPIVEYNTPIEKLKTLINKENGAVLSKDEAGHFHIVTKYDVIQALGN